MKWIISPAKQMGEDGDFLAPAALPAFLDEAEQLLEYLRGLSRPELKKLLACSDALAEQNHQRYQTMDLRRNLTPALLAYRGIQYRYMAPNVLEEGDYGWLQEHLRILSGFYGLLRPFDGVTPYRLEMQAKLNVCDAKGLYSYWNSDIAEKLFSETDCILNLASKEYSLCVSRYLKPEIRFITCVFGEEKNGKIIEKGTMCKMARGEMVRYMAEQRIEDPEEIKAFDHLGYAFDAARSDEKTFVFLRKEAASCSWD